ncbi:TnsD family Tn7-like transposition protein [Rhodocyclus tenuis]|uniref:Transposon Tn7 transposition protein TnsD C-termianl domain-containing protein n=1 Tax=Rhodocyclus tenuis TaxID=1066 RepID=A0A840G8X0_RHOTE|nr:TnsD family Tn7-like transposition protein [Rhodocyclus tenuis]MBB4248783.1 hypothetical protein [Rhodocyclus tenuis]
MRLPGFPIAQPGETFASVAARHLARSSTPKIRHLKLLGLRIASASSLIPHDLRHFVSILPPGHPWEGAPKRIALDHTLVPLFLHFCHPKRAAETLTTIVTGESTNPAATLGITVSQGQSMLNAGKFCPECLAHDLKTLGYPVLYRQHQPSFVRMCATHARPLHSSCVRCRSTRNAVSMWQVAGRCGCSDPLTPPLFGMGHDALTEASWLWLSKQVSAILAAPIPSEPIAAHLFSALRNGGFAAVRGGLDSAAMIDALIDRFGEPLLRELGTGSWFDSQPHKHRPSRTLTRSALDGRRIPNVLHMLLLTRLITHDIATLSKPIAAEPKQRINRQPSGYGQLRSNERTRLDARAMLSAIDSAEGKITVAAQRLGVHSYTLASVMRRQGIRLPLPPATARRLGVERLAAVRSALRQGLPKYEIAQQFDVSEWSILLIELDQPELRNAHRDATIARQREKHREALHTFLRSNPRETRDDFAKNHAGAYDWLREYDRDWLEAKLPAPVRNAHRNTRIARKNWLKMDQDAVASIRRTVHEEMCKPDRPTRLTQTRLLSAAGALSVMNRNAQHRYPSAKAEAEHSAETEEQFRNRAIRWALDKYAEQRIPISINKLRRVARLPARQLIEQRDYVVEVAAELGLTFDARCSLAPWNQ